MNKPTYPSLLRRLACIFYDVLLLFSLLFVGSFLVLPFTGGEAVASDNLFYPLLLFLGCYLYFTWQWIHGGQTLGMRAWHCQVIIDDNSPVNWLNGSKRFFLSLLSWCFLGLGFLMAIFRDDNKTFHDIYSGTVLIYRFP